MARTGWNKGKSAIFLQGCSATRVYNVVIALSVCCWQRRVFFFFSPPINFSPFAELCTLVVGFLAFILTILYRSWQQSMTYMQFCQHVFLQKCILHLEDNRNFQPPAHSRQQISVLYLYHAIVQCKLFGFV